MTRIFNKVLEYTAITAVFATIFVPLAVSVSLFFPYITGKAHMFRFLVLLATAAYLLLVIRDKSFLPRKNVLLWSSVAFTAVLGLATLTAIDPVRSFWSNFERMEGYVTIVHLFAFFIVAASVFRTRLTWAVLFGSSLVVSILMGIQGFIEMAEKDGVFGSFRMSGTLGNSSYLGIYSLMHVFIAGFLAAVLFKTKPFFGRLATFIGIGIAGLFNLIVMYSTGTRGSFAGLVAGLFIATVLVALFEKNNKSYRKAAIGALGAVVVIVALLGAFKNTSFIKGNDLLYRFSSLVTTDVKGVLAEQGKARTLLWGMSWQGVQERPLLGWGQDNFAFVFAKHYDPAMYGQEQWFDRTHNVFMDWLIASGFLGLISYLGLFAAALYMIWRNKSSEAEWTITERAILTGFLAAYFVHNLFVFDNLSSYVLFFLMLGYVSARHDGRSRNDIKSSNGVPLLASEPVQYVVGTAVVIAMVAGMYFIVYKPYMAGRTLIKALQAGAAQNPSAENVLALYNKALSYNTFGTTEINERLAEAAPQIIQANQGKPVVDEAIRLVATQYEEAFKRTPEDPRPFIFYGMFMQRLGLYDDALSYIEKAVALSPSKQSFHYQKGLTLVAQGKMAEASEAFKVAYELDKTNLEAKNLYGISLIYANRLADARTLFGDDMASWTDTRVLSVLEETRNFGEIIRIAKAKVDEEPANPQYRMSLAGAYLKAKQPANAIAEIQAVIQLVPEFKAQGDAYIKDIRAGKDPSAQAAQ